VVEFRTRLSTLDAHLPFLDAQWTGGCRNGAELWRRLKAQGFQGSQRVVAEWATRVQRARYMTLETIATLSDDSTVSLPALAG
jgi:hypothetical protein